MKLWSRWVAFLSRTETGESLALVRILVGLVVLWVVRLDWSIADPMWLDIEHGGYRPFKNPGWLIELLGGFTPEVVTGLMLAAASGGVLLVLGVLPRLAALVSLQCLLALTNINNHASGSDDVLLTNVLWLMVLADSSATLSLSCRIRTGSWFSARAVTSWPRYLMIGQLITLYAATGLQKVSAHWVPGGDLGALYYILQQPSWIRQDMPGLANIYGLTQAATLATWMFEVGAPVLVLAYWYRNTRHPVALPSAI